MRGCLKPRAQCFCVGRVHEEGWDAVQRPLGILEGRRSLLKACITRVIRAKSVSLTYAAYVSFGNSTAETSCPLCRAPESGPFDTTSAEKPAAYKLLDQYGFLRDLSEVKLRSEKSCVAG